MKITILGNNSAIFANGRHPSAQIVEIADDLLLIDCGEGTQTQMQRFGIKHRRIRYILISHLHGDHYFGLIGLLTTMSLMNRAESIQLFGPPELKNIIDIQLSVASTQLSFEVNFTAIQPQDEKLLIAASNLSVTCFPTVHRIPCHGFLIEEKKRGRKILSEACRKYEVPTYFFQKLKEGENYINKNGDIIQNEWVTEAPPPSKKYAYCADSSYTEQYLNLIQSVDVMYHESTYLNDLAERAEERFHSTALQAATLAGKAKAKRLLLGHFSSKYNDVSLFEKEARSIFPDTEATHEGTTYEI